mgnify:CR=1 FL=1
MLNFPPLNIGKVMFWSKIIDFTLFWRLSPPPDRVHPVAGGYFPQKVVTYYSVTNTKTILRTKIVIPQSQNVKNGKI